MSDPIAPMQMDAPTLAGRFVRLEPIEERHREDLRAAAQDDAIWPYMPLNGAADFDPMFDDALAARAEGAMLPFIVVRRADETVVGGTRYLNIAPRDRRLEIGWTWYAPADQGGPVNPECKLLLLGHAFETLGAYRVELRCDGRNGRSRAAIAKLGAVEEGVLRRHMQVQDGFWRDTVVFAVLDAEWRAVKAGLEARLT